MSSGPPDRRLSPPSGHPPPTEGLLADDVTVPLVPLAREICRRYREEFPDEQERYGDAGQAWCVHDNQHLLFWGAGAVNGFVDMEREVDWLARVLDAREFPLDRLARNLDLAAEVVTENVTESVAGDRGREWADVMAASAAYVRQRVAASSDD